MKKIALSIGILFIVAFIGTYTIQAHTEFNGVSRPCHSQNRNADYAWLYTHLSDTDRALVGAKEVELLENIDWNLLTAEEKVITLNQVKTELAAYIMDEDMVTYGGRR